MTGRGDGNRMVNMQLTNDKLVDRGVKMLMDRTGITDYETAREILLRHGTVKSAAQTLGK